MEIGGFFPYQPVDSEPNNYVEHTCPDPGDTAHLMSGRCAIYYCLRDLMLCFAVTVIFSAEAITTAVAVAIHAATLAVTITKTIAAKIYCT